MPSTADNYKMAHSRETDLRYGNGLLTTGHIPNLPNLDKGVRHAAAADSLFSAPAALR